jgi:hypothetical protein
MGERQSAFQQFLTKLGDDDRVPVNPIAWFDSVLTQVNQIVPQAARAVMDNTGITSAMEQARVLSEIERQLFLQFLLSERAYLRRPQIMGKWDLFQKINLDIQICQKKQAQITSSLFRIINIEGISASAYSVLTMEQGQTLTAAMAFAENVTRQQSAAITNLYDFLNNRETGAARRVLDQVFEWYVDTDVKFSSRDAWEVLRKRWNAWGTKYDERMSDFIDLWDSMGGGKDLNSNPQALKMIDDYYQELYKQIESGNVLAWARMLDQGVPRDNGQMVGSGRS